MNIEYPLHALTGVSFQSERTPNNPNDTHYSVFDSKHGCVAHVFNERLAIKMAASPELLEALQLDLTFHSRPFVADSIKEFRAAGYTGLAEGNEMRHFLNEKKLAAITKATGGAQ